MKTIQWGIIGVGNIARKFAGGFSQVKDAQLLAVASQSADRSAAFAREFQIAASYSSYEALLSDPRIDVVYIATRNHAHAPVMEACLKDGKAVLCEKPFTLNTAQARRIIQMAREKKLFLMEGMWTRCFPLIKQVREWVTQGQIGQVHLVRADFGFPTAYDPNGRLFNPEFGGGALLDVGVYTLAMASMILGTPTRIESQVKLSPSRVDDYTAIQLSYANEASAQLHCSVRAHTPKEALIVGERGFIKIEVPFWKPRTISVEKDGGTPQVINQPYEGFGFHFEIQEVTNCLRQGTLECPLMPLDETLQIMSQMDAIRQKWGIVFPGE
jgi:predicted dehydrogenase